MRLEIKITSRRAREQRGAILAESLVALAILSIIGVSLLTATATGFLTSGTIADNATANNLARAQLEEIKNSPFLAGGDYPALTPPPGYSVSVDVLSIEGGDGNVQRIRVTVLKSDKNLLVAEDFKVNR
ncbi:MAG: hypothetical protein V3T71_01610 [Dehalococcoidia bacterium]